MRILKDGSDKRFDKARDNPSVLFKFWTIQGLWVFITLLPTLIQNGERRTPLIGRRDYIGWAIWGLGFLFEVVADMQKSIFRANPANDVSFLCLFSSLHYWLFRENSSLLVCGASLGIQIILEKFLSGLAFTFPAQVSSEELSISLSSVQSWSCFWSPSFLVTFVYGF